MDRSSSVCRVDAVNKIVIIDLQVRFEFIYQKQLAVPKGGWLWTLITVLQSKKVTLVILEGALP